MAGRYTITPWRQHADLLEVRGQLYRRTATGEAVKQDERRQAVDRVIAWKLRGNLPHAVESTALLVDAFLHYEMFLASAQQFTAYSHATGSSLAPAQLSSWSTRAVLTAAFTRFVTGYCDIGRARERALEPSSMLVIARQIGMPAEWVALRHEATHEEMPALGRLVRACEASLGWLWDVYWARLPDLRAVAGEDGAVGRAGEENEGEVKAETRAILKAYRSRRKEGFKARKRKAGGEGVVETAETALQAFGYLLVGRESGSELVAKVLVEEKWLVPSERPLEAPMDGAYLLWDELLLALSSQYREFPVTLMRILLNKTTDSVELMEEDNPIQEALMLWIAHIVGSAVWQNVRTRTNSDVRTTTVKHCCLNPGYWSQRLGTVVLQNADPAFRALWQPLLEASELRTDVLESDQEEANISEHPLEAAEPGVETLDRQLPDASQCSTRWLRAAVPPSVPIGVVA